VDDECPADGIEVPVWRVAKGGLELTRDKFYTQAEAPKFVEESQSSAMASGDMPIKPLKKDNSRTVVSDVNPPGFNRSLPIIPEEQSRENNLEV
jgi:hypothetical protein